MKDSLTGRWPCCHDRPWQEHDHVFCREDGTSLDRWLVRKEFAKITKTARLGAEWSPRKLRHSFGSILSARDVRLEDISVGPYSGPARRIELPPFAMVGDHEVRFMKREMGIFGLDVAVVWHPGWPIEHPLVAEGRAAVLWPNPATIDFVAMGEVRYGEISIVISADNADEK